MTTKQFLKSIFLNQPGLIMKNGKPYIPTRSIGDYFKCGGKLIKRQSCGIQRKFN